VASMFEAGTVEFEPESGAVRHLTVREADEAETADALARVTVTNYRQMRDRELLTSHQTEVHVLSAWDDEFSDVPLALLLSPDGGVGRALVYAHGQETPSVELSDLGPLVPMTLPWGAEVVPARHGFRAVRWDSTAVTRGEWLALLVPLAP